MTSWIRSASAALVLAAALAGPGAAGAASPKDKAAAKAAVAEARKAYDLGRFEEAIAGYTRAYDLSELPALLFNVAQCHRQLKQYERAAFFYGRYLSLQPPPIDNEENARALRKEMEDAAAAEKAKNAGLGLDLTAEEPGPAEPKEPVVESASATVPPEALPVAPPAAPSTPPATAEEPTPLVKQWWLWTLVGVVVVGGAVAAGALATGAGASTPPYTTLDDVHF